jgi:hypothetical protein
MYFIIKYNVLYKYIINATTTPINTCKKLFEFGQREVISFFTLVTNKGEHSIKLNIMVIYLLQKLLKKYPINFNPTKTFMT